MLNDIARNRNSVLKKNDIHLEDRLSTTYIYHFAKYFMMHKKYFEVHQPTTHVMINLIEEKTR
jgi:hypothetical protein